MADTLFNNVGAKFVFRKIRNLCLEAIAQRVGKVRVVQIHNVLKNVVAKRVLHKCKSILSNLRDEVGFLLAGCVVDASLQDATAVTMSADNDTVCTNGVKNKLRMLAGSLGSSTEYEPVHLLALVDLGIFELRGCHSDPESAQQLYPRGHESQFESKIVRRRPLSTFTKTSTCSGVEINSIIFCKARVPCWLRAILTICEDALLTRTVLCASFECSSSF